MATNNGTLYQQSQPLIKQGNIANTTYQSIIDKAKTGQALSKPTAEKQAIYDLYQNSYKDEITRKAQAGQALTDPNDWKNSIYQSALGKNTIGGDGTISVKPPANDQGVVGKPNMPTTPVTPTQPDIPLPGGITNPNQGQDIANVINSDWEKKFLAQQNEYAERIKQLENQLKYNQLQSQQNLGYNGGTGQHIYDPGLSSGNTGYTGGQIVTNELLNKYLQNIFTGGF